MFHPSSFPHRLYYSSILCVSLLIIVILFSFFNPNKPPVITKSNYKVPVDLFVMSKCPDAVLCEDVMASVIQEIGEIAQVDINFIGTLDSEDKKFGVQCKHGEAECLGNIQELCAKRVASDRWYQFVLCLNENYRQIGVSHLLTNICLERADINPAKFHSCVRTNGPKLLKSSVTISRNLNATKSCTILINKGEYKCIHDEVWKDCPAGYEVADFVKQICQSYTGENLPPTCDKFKH